MSTSVCSNSSSFQPVSCNSISSIPVLSLDDISYLNQSIFALKPGQSSEDVREFFQQHKKHFNNRPSELFELVLLVTLPMLLFKMESFDEWDLIKNELSQNITNPNANYQILKQTALEIIRTGHYTFLSEITKEFELSNELLYQVIVRDKNGYLIQAALCHDKNAETKLISTLQKNCSLSVAYYSINISVWEYIAKSYAQVGVDCPEHIIIGLLSAGDVYQLFIDQTLLEFRTHLSTEADYTYYSQKIQIIGEFLIRNCLWYQLSILIKCIPHSMKSTTLRILSTQIKSDFWGTIPGHVLLAFITLSNGCRYDPDILINTFRSDININQICEQYRFHHTNCGSSDTSSLQNSTLSNYLSDTSKHLASIDSLLCESPKQTNETNDISIDKLDLTMNHNDLPESPKETDHLGHNIEQSDDHIPTIEDLTLRNDELNNNDTQHEIKHEEKKEPNQKTIRVPPGFKPKN